MLELARPEDRAEVNRLAAQVHAMHAAWRPDIYEMPEELYPEDRFAEALKARQIYTAKVSGILIGYVLIKIRDYDLPGHVKRKVLVLDEICVEETARGMGLGTEIMADVHALARAFGCTDMQLGVYPQNDAAVAFYQKCGFTIRNINMQRKV